MAEQMLTIAVAGADGRQGGAVARTLLRRGHDVVALTRHPDSDHAQELARLGARLVPGDAGDPGSVERAMRGADAAFVVARRGGPSVAKRRGRELLEAAERTRCPHVVLSTLASADRAGDLAFFRAQHVLEEEVRARGLSHTILRPVWFMENLLKDGIVRRLAFGRLQLPLRADRPVQLVALEDLATLAALACEDPASMRGRTVEVASDTCTPLDMAQILGAVIGAELVFQHAPLHRIAADETEEAQLLTWMERVGFDVDVGALHQAFPEVGWHRFGRWTAARDWSVLDEHRVPAGTR